MSQHMPSEIGKPNLKKVLMRMYRQATKNLHDNEGVRFPFGSGYSAKRELPHVP